MSIFLLQDVHPYLKPGLFPISSTLRNCHQQQSLNPLWQQQIATSHYSDMFRAAARLPRAGCRLVAPRFARSFNYNSYSHFQAFDTQHTRHKRVLKIILWLVTCTAVAYLTTRVREPDKNDWKKLVHLMKYIRGTAKLPLILRANGSGIVKWWIDGSFGVHPNMLGHTGGGLSMGTGFPIVNSTKQKLNTRSSTESELVGVDDCMPAVCWTRYFLEAQGYGVVENIVFQDNQSAILLEKNGKQSSGKKTRHMDIRYFFITDNINGILVRLCDQTGHLGTT